MPLPSGIATVTVTGQNLCDLEGNPAVSGMVYFLASNTLADPTHNTVISEYRVQTPVVNGVMVPVLLPINDGTVNPQNFTYTVRTELYYGTSVTPVVTDNPVAITHLNEPTVDLASLLPVSSFTAVSGISIVGSGTIGQVLTNLGNDTANWQNPQASSTTFSRQVLIDLSGSHSVETATVGVWTSHYYMDTDTGGLFQGWVSQNDPGSLNDSASYDFACGAGTYKLELLHLVSTNRAIYTVKIDGGTVGTIDGYAGAFGYVRSTLTNVSISAGQHVLTFVALTKNASSSGYDMLFERAILTQTA